MTKDPNRSESAKKVALIGLFSNVFLTLLKFLAGIMGHSSAMIADATHSLSDLITDIIVFLGFRVAGKPADSTHQYGHGKIETLLAGICGMFLFFAGIGICAGGIKNLILYMRGIPVPRPGTIALAAALVSVCAKELLFRYTIFRARILSSPALSAKAWDHRSDAFSSVATLIGIGGAILLGPAWRVLDPLAAILVSGFIIKVAFTILAESLNELLEASIDREMKAKILNVINEDPEVRDIHLMRTRKIGPYFAIEAHIMVDRSLSLVEAHDVSTRIERSIHEIFGDETLITLHVEPLPRKGGFHTES